MGDTVFVSMNLEENSCNGYLNADQCLVVLFPDETSRPSLRTFRTWQAAGKIPYLKLGRLTFFNPNEVKLALERQFARRVK